MSHLAPYWNPPRAEPAQVLSPAGGSAGHQTGKEKILLSGAASLGPVSLPHFLGLLGLGPRPWDYLLLCQKEVGGALCWGLAAPGDRVSKPEFPTEVEGHGSALDLDRVLLHFSNVGSTKLKTFS